MISIKNAIQLLIIPFISIGICSFSLFAASLTATQSGNALTAMSVSDA